MVNGEFGVPFGLQLFTCYEDTGPPPQGIGVDMIADTCVQKRVNRPPVLLDI